MTGSRPFRLPRAVFAELPLGSGRPAGWLLRLLRRQRDGLTGHLDEIGYPFDTDAWRSRRVSRWWEPYEQNAYWIDGMLRLGRLLGDRALTGKAKGFLDAIIARQDADGYLGPQFLKRTYPQEFLRSDRFPLAAYYFGFQRWPLAVLFRAFMAEYQAGGDRTIPRALLRHYRNDPADYSIARCVMHVEIMAWLHAVTGDRGMARMAERVFRRKQRLEGPTGEMSLCRMLSDERMTGHGVTIMEEGKLGAILYMLTGRKRLLRASLNTFEKLERDHMLVDGIPSSEEGLRGKGYLRAHETCDCADYTWSCGYLLMATGDARWGDRIERAVFNAALGSVRKDFRACQYFSAPNQVVATTTSDHLPGWQGDERMAYMPIHGQYCCAGNVNRILPNYAARMWMRSDDRGTARIAAVLYGPTVLDTAVGRTPVRIQQRTAYPFSEEIAFSFLVDAPVAFAFAMRIPAWCAAAEIRLNGEPLTVSTAPGTFATIRRIFASGDRLVLRLPMRIALHDHAGVGWYVERGPLVYALRIRERWSRPPAYQFDATRDFPVWHAEPRSPFSYALAIDPARPEASITVVRRNTTRGDPWDAARTPILLRVPARRIRNVALDRHHEVVREGRTVKGDFAFTPDLPAPGFIKRNLSKRVERILLVPYGCTHLRTTLFPLSR